MAQDPSGSCAGARFRPSKGAGDMKAGSGDEAQVGLEGGKRASRLGGTPVFSVVSEDL